MQMINNKKADSYSHIHVGKEIKDGNFYCYVTYEVVFSLQFTN